MRCFLEDEVREFDIEVMKVDQETAEINKGMMIRVTDEELLEKNRRNHSGDERQSDPSERKTDRGGDARICHGFDKRLRHFCGNNAGTVEMTRIVENAVELLLQNLLDSARCRGI